MVSKACDSQESSGSSAALIPPWAAFEWERTGWTLEMIPTDEPSSAAARAARCPARPAPMTRTSCWGIRGGANDSMRTPSPASAGVPGLPGGRGRLGAARGLVHGYAVPAAVLGLVHRAVGL